MQPYRPQLLPAGPGTLYPALDVLNGVVDMRTYQRRYLTIYTVSNVTNGITALSTLTQADYGGTLGPLTDCIEWLDEHFGFEVVSVFNREATGTYLATYAMLRRRSAPAAGQPD